MKLRSTILNTLAIAFMTAALIAGALGLHSICPQVYAAAGDKLELVGDPIGYVQSGNEAYFQVQIKNISGSTLRGVTVAHGFGSLEDYNAFARDEEYEFHEGYSSMTALDPYWNEDETWYRFSSAFESKGHGAINAVWDSDEEGYTIQAGQTATIWFRINSKHEEPGAYNDCWVVFGDIHSELIGGFYPVPIFDEAYTGHINIKTVTYNPSAAAVTLGTSTDNGKTITPLAQGTAIDFGTIDISQDTGLTGEKTYYTRNTSTISSSGKDEHGQSQDIEVELDVENYDASEFLYHSPLGCNSHMNTGSHWSPLPPAPMSSNTWQMATTGITLNTEYFVEGTYNAVFRLRTMPHGVNVNGGGIRTNGVYEWPVTVKLTGTNPRIPEAPINVTATAGNGQAEITWNAAPDAEEDAKYYVYRREGRETHTENLRNSAFDWSSYECLGNDTPDDEGNYLFIDASAENGKTYTYIVIGGIPLGAYPAISEAVKPLSTINSKLQAPDIYVGSEKGGVTVGWNMNDNYGGSFSDGSSMVDHFNVYRDNVLVAQISQSAVIATPEYGWGPDPDDPDTSTYHLLNNTYGWETFVETPVAYQDYAWTVAAVSKSGIEGYRSGVYSACGLDDSLCIQDHTAEVYLDDTLYADLSINIAGYMSADRIEWWRAEGTTAPDTSKTPLRVNHQTGYYADTTFEDTTIQKGKTYTYSVRAYDEEGKASNTYTFRIKVPTGSDWWSRYFSSTDFEWSIINGKKAKLKWYADYNYDDDNQLYYYGTYKVYRNGAVLKTFTIGNNSDPLMVFENDPGTDGTYTYRVDKTVNGVTVRGREFVFTRNTAPVDVSSLPQVPSAPLFDVRMSGDNPVLHWAATNDGGKVDGFHIYRKSAGKYVNGRYRNSYNTEVYWSNMRYISIADPSDGVLTDVYGNYDPDDPTKGYLQGVSWTESACPHEYWITAYNSAGESEPSRVVTLEYQGEDEIGNPVPPSNEDEHAPGKPVIDKLWVEWDDDSNYSTEWDYAIGGFLHTSWDDAQGSLGSIDKWTLNYTGLWDEDYVNKEELYSWQAAKDKGATKGQGMYAPTTSVRAGSAEDFGKNVIVTVAAENSAGSTVSDAASLKILSFPRARVTAGSGHAVVRWTDLFEDETTVVDSWEIWRKREYGSWAKTKTISASGLEYEKDKNGNYVTDRRGVKNYAWKDTEASNGWAYEYKVVAKCADGKDRESVIRKARPTASSSTEEPGAVRNLSWKIVNGEVQLTWDPPATGTPQYYKVMYEYKFPYYDEPLWCHAGSVNAPSDNYVWDMSEAGTYRCFVYTTSYIDGSEVPDGDDDGSLEEQYPSMSNIVTVKLTQENVDQQPKQGPGGITLTATPGDGSVTLNWSQSARATYYTITRDSTEDPAEFPEVTLPASVRTYTDRSALPGVRYVYKVSPHNSYSWTYQTVVGIANGKTKDEIAADSVIAMIEALPEADTLDLSNIEQYEGNIRDAAEAYDNLTVKQRNLISQTLKDKLAACQDALELIRIIDEYMDTASPVIELIEALPALDDITLDDEEAVSAARAAYNALPAEARRLVDEGPLLAAETKIKALKKAAADKVIVDALIDDLENLQTMDEVNEENAEAIIDMTEAIKSRIDALDKDQKNMLNGTDGIIDLLNKLAETDARAKAVLGLPHDHIVELSMEIPATCVKPGRITCYVCKACDKCFTGPDAAEQISDEDAVIPVDDTGHDWGEWTEEVPATCTHEGTLRRVCKNDPSHAETVTVSMVSHEWKTEPESATTDGSGITTYVYKCKNCDTTRTASTSNVDPDSQCAGNHAWDWDDPDEYVAPTCTTEGYTRYHCKNENCSGTVIEIQEIDPSAHDWGAWEADPDATCTVSGRSVRVCRHDSGHIEEKIIDAKGHSWDEGEVLSESTCTEPGLKRYTCNACGLQKNVITDIDEHNHDWYDWVVTEEPTCTQAGKQRRECFRDASHVEEGVVPPVGHKWDAGKVTKTATVNATGIKTYTCTVCGAQKNEVIAKLKIVTKTDLAKITMLKPKAGKKKVTIKWKKISSKNRKKMKHVEIQVATDKSFKKIVKKTTAGKKATSKTIKGLKSKKKYWIRIRAYNMTGNVVHCSKWTVKTVKVK